MATFGFEVLKNSFLVFVNTKGGKKKEKTNGDRKGIFQHFPKTSTHRQTPARQFILTLQQRLSRHQKTRHVATTLRQIAGNTIAAFS